MERDAQFVYLALERCAAALHDVVESPPTAPPAAAIAAKKMQFVTPRTDNGGAPAGKAAVGDDK